jgi:hypothetical protein
MAVSMLSLSYKESNMYTFSTLSKQLEDFNKRTVVELARSGVTFISIFPNYIAQWCLVCCFFLYVGKCLVKGCVLQCNNYSTGKPITNTEKELMSLY